MKPIVSVIIPTHNAAPFVRQAVDSVLTQHSVEFEVDVVVVDDGSTDETLEILASYGSRIRYFRIPHSGKPGFVRNYGIQQARGSYLAFLDDDDYLLDKSLHQRLSILEADAGIGFVYSNYYVLDEGRLTLGQDEKRLRSGWIFEQLFSANFIHTSTVLARRVAVEQSKGFHLSARSAEDYWLWLQLARRWPAGLVNEPTSVYRARAGNLSKRPVTKKIPDLVAVVQGVATEFSMPRARVRARINPLRLWLAKEYWRQERYGVAVRWLLPAVLTESSERWAVWARRRIAAGFIGRS